MLPWRVCGDRYAGAMSNGALLRSTVAIYAAGSLGTGGFATLPGLVLTYYLTNSLGVTALLAGVLVTAAKLWDAVIDPVIGPPSDRPLRPRGTRRRPSRGQSGGF